jgi:mycothiol S-conjugate amidase
MCVHAHPDDESSKGAATMARYVTEGVDVLVVTCTGGERGDILNPALAERADILENIHEVRRKEMDAARAILGVRQEWLGFVDSGFPDGLMDPDRDPALPLPALPEGCFGLVPLEDAARPLVQLIRRERPHVVVTYDENGGYPHPDHIKTHEVSMEAFEAAGDPGRYPGTGEPWQPLKLYYHLTFHKQRLVALHEALTELRMESPYAKWLDTWVDKPEDEARLTTRVPCDEFFHTRDRALLAHATQVDPQGAWFKVPLDVQRKVWPTEDYQLARSHVPTDLPEDDLFAGIREAVEARP